MTRIKLCGLRREEDVKWANELMPSYVGFVFAKKSKRYVDKETARKLRTILDPKIEAVGVFVNEDLAFMKELLDEDIIQVVQLHGSEDEAYIQSVRKLTDKTIIKAFKVESIKDVQTACESSADYILLDSGAGGTGEAFDWDFLLGATREYFLAGGLYPGNIKEAVEKYKPYAVDVSSGIETDGFKDPKKMTDFVEAVRKEDEKR